MSEEEIQEQEVEAVEPQEEVVSEVVDESPQPEETPSLDLEAVFDETPETRPGQSDEFNQALENLGVQVGEGMRPRDALLNAYQQAADYNHQWQQYHQDQQQRQSAYQQQLAQQQQLRQQQMMMMQQQQAAQAQQAQQQDWSQLQQQQEQHDPDSWWNPPKLDEAELERWRTQVRNRRTGQWEWMWKAGTPRELRERADDVVKYHEEWQRDLVQKPQEVLPQIIEKEFDKLFVDRYGALLDEFEGRQQEQDMHQRVADINQRNSDWVYQHDPMGNIVIDPSGQPALTPQGQRVIEIIGGLRQSGLTDPDKLWDTASRLLAGELAQGALGRQQQQMQQTQQVQERNMRHLQQGAGSIRNREGSVAPPENPSPNSQNRNLSPGDKLRQQALADGLF